MSVAFTPGPWSLRLGSLRPSVETPSGNWFKSHRDGESETGIAADARLIAAAPELYEALVGLVEANIKRGPFDEPLGSSEQTQEMNSAVAALAKARGEQ